MYVWITRMYTYISIYMYHTYVYVYICICIIGVAPLKLLDFGSACDIKSGAGLNQVSRVLTYADVC
jgi:hypothetical protein